MKDKEVRIMFKEQLVERIRQAKENGELLFNEELNYAKKQKLIDEKRKTSSTLKSAFLIVILKEAIKKQKISLGQNRPVNFLSSRSLILSNISMNSSMLNPYGSIN